MKSRHYIEPITLTPEQDLAVRKLFNIPPCEEMFDIKVSTSASDKFYTSFSSFEDTIQAMGLTVEQYEECFDDTESDVTMTQIEEYLKSHGSQQLATA
jgi:hypothetical protein